MPNQIVGYPDPSRVVGSALFSSLTSATVLTSTNPNASTPWDGENDMVVTFSANLTNSEYVACRRRLIRTTEREDLEVSAQTALTTINTYLALADPTAAETTAQVKALGRVYKGLIKMVVPDLASMDSNPGA